MVSRSLSVGLLLLLMSAGCSRAEPKTATSYRVDKKTEQPAPLGGFTIHEGASVEGLTSQLDSLGIGWFMSDEGSLTFATTIPPLRAAIDTSDGLVKSARCSLDFEQSEIDAPYIEVTQVTLLDSGGILLRFDAIEISSGPDPSWEVLTPIATPSADNSLSLADGDNPETAK